MSPNSQVSRLLFKEHVRDRYNQDLAWEAECV